MILKVASYILAFFAILGPIVVGSLIGLWILMWLATLPAQTLFVGIMAILLIPLTYLIFLVLDGPEVAKKIETFLSRKA